MSHAHAAKCARQQRHHAHAPIRLAASTTGFRRVHAAPPRTQGEAPLDGRREKRDNPSCKVAAAGRALWMPHEG